MGCHVHILLPHFFTVLPSSPGKPPAHLFHLHRTVCSWRKLSFETHRNTSLPRHTFFVQHKPPGHTFFVHLNRTAVGTNHLKVHHDEAGHSQRKRKVDDARDKEDRHTAGAHVEQVHMLSRHARRAGRLASPTRILHECLEGMCWRNSDDTKRAQSRCMPSLALQRSCLF